MQPYSPYHPCSFHCTKNIDPLVAKISQNIPPCSAVTTCVQKINFTLPILWEKPLEVLRALKCQIASVKENDCSSKRLTSKCFISEEIESPKVIYSPQWHKNICNIGPMVAQINKKHVWPRNVQARLYIRENQGGEGCRCCQERYRGRYIRAQLPKFSEYLLKPIAPLRYAVSLIDCNHTYILGEIGWLHELWERGMI